MLATLPVHSKHGSKDIQQYAACLKESMLDRIIDLDEQEHLFDAAKHSNLSQDDILTVHRTYLENIIMFYLEDTIISESELSDLRIVHTFLGLEHFGFDLDEEIKRISNESINQRQKSFIQDLTNKSVCFTGNFKTMINDKALSRDDVIHIAEEHGMKVLKSVTKKLSYLVSSDPNSLSSKANKARKYGIPILTEQSFFNMLGIQTD